MASKYHKLQNKHVLIIGGTSGIGYAVAAASLASGAQVTVSSSKQSRVDAAVEKLRAEFPNSTSAGHVCDLSKPTVEEDIKALFSKVGKVDHIVFTAGDRPITAPVSETTYEKIIAAGHVRFVAPQLVVKVGSQYLSPGPHSSITLTTGAVALRPIPEWTILAGYTSALHGLTRALAVELKPLRVNLVSPGYVYSEMWDGIMDAETKEKQAQGVAGAVLTGRAALPEDLAEVYLFLMKSPDVTGSVINSDSGILLV